MTKDSTKHEYADEKKTVIKRTQITHFDLVSILAEINAIDAKIAALPKEKPPLTREKYDEAFFKTGLSFNEAQESLDLLNQNSQSGRRRFELTERRQALSNQIAELKAKVGRSRSSG